MERRLRMYVPVNLVFIHNNLNPNFSDWINKKRYKINTLQYNKQ